MGQEPPSYSYLLTGSFFISAGAGTMALFAFKGQLLPVYIGIISFILGYSIAQRAESDGNEERASLRFLSPSTRQGTIKSVLIRSDSTTPLRDQATSHMAYRGVLGIAGIGLLGRGFLLLATGIAGNSLQSVTYAGITLTAGYFATHRSVNNTWI